MIINKVFDKLNKIGFNNLIFMTPHLYSIGNYSEDLMYGIMKAKFSNKKIFLLSPYNSKFLFSKKICNEEIIQLESKYIYDQKLIVYHTMKLLVTIMMLPSRSLDRVLNMIGKFLPEEKVVPRVGVNNGLWSTEDEMKTGFSWDVVNKYQWHKKIEADYDLDINYFKKKIARRLLSEIGVDFSTWYVCVHVRESGFRNDHGRREYRNSSIFNYISAIKAITDAGGVVVRMGDSTMTPLPVLPNVIDYSSSSQKSPLLDLYLIKHCRFFLGTHSGIFDTAQMFFKDTLVTNMVSLYFGYPLRKKDRGIYKHVYSKAHGRYLTFHEVLNTDWKLQNVFGDIDDNYELTENTAEDIKMVVSEYLHCHVSNGFSLSQNQLDVNMKRVSQAKEIYNKSNLIDDSDKLRETFMRYRLASRLSIHSQGSMSDSYLQKYLHQPYFKNKAII